MAIRYCVDPDQRLLQVEMRGEVDRDQLLCFFKTLAEDPKLDPKLKRLTLIDATLDADINSEAIRQSARLALASPLKETDQSRQAIVAASDISFGVARMYALLCNFPPETFRIFRNMGEALWWLDVSPVEDKADVTWTNIVR